MSAATKGGLYAVCSAFIVLSTTAVSLRLYARRYQKVELGWDDWTALFGFMTYIAAAAIAIRFAVWDVGGYGHPTPQEALAKGHRFVELAYAYDYLNVNTLACAKWSALFMYKRIFAVGRHTWFNRVILGTAVIILLWYISSDFLSLYQCPGHFSAAWDGEFAKYCYLNNTWAKQLSISDFVLDIWVLVLPIVPIMRLHTTLGKKFGILGVFLLAFVGLGASVARIVFFAGAHAGSPQVTYIAMLEEGMSITVVNLPSIYYLCTSVIPNRVASSMHSLRSLGSHNSDLSRSRSIAASATMTSDESQVKVPGNALVAQAKPSWSSQRLGLGSGFHVNIEAIRDPYEFSASDMDARHD